MMFPFPSNSRLHKRRDKLQQRGRDARVQRDAREVAVRDDLRLGACGVKIRHDVLDTRAVIEIHRIFKVQIQAAEIQIDRADDRLNTVGQIDLGVDEAGPGSTTVKRSILTLPAVTVHAAAIGSLLLGIGSGLWLAVALPG